MILPPTQALPLSKPTPPDPASDEARMRQAAQDLEASFLSEMLKAAKFGEPRKSFGGGAGEGHFASFLRAEVAKDMAATGGIGLAEHLFQAMKDRSHGAG